MASLQDHLDRVEEQLARGESVEPGAALIEGSENWELTFSGISKRLHRLVWLPALRHLLERPETPVAEADLPSDKATGSLPGNRKQRRDAVRLLSAGCPGGMDVADHQAINDLKKALELKIRESDNAETLVHFDRAKKFDEEAAEMEKELARMIGLGGRRRRAGDPKQQQAAAVRKGVWRTIDAIEREHPLAGEHLRSSIKKRCALCYRPDPPVTWRT